MRACVRACMRACYACVLCVRVSVCLHVGGAGKQVINTLKILSNNKGGYTTVPVTNVGQGH